MLSSALGRGNANAELWAPTPHFPFRTPSSICRSTLGSTIAASSSTYLCWHTWYPDCRSAGAGSVSVPCSASARHDLRYLLLSAQNIDPACSSSLLTLLLSAARSQSWTFTPASSDPARTAGPASSTVVPGGTFGAGIAGTSCTAGVDRPSTLIPSECSFPLEYNAQRGSMYELMSKLRKFNK